MNRDDWLMCNCSQCGVELLAQSMRATLAAGVLTIDDPGFVAGRIFGRPFCAGCLRVRPIPAGAGKAEDDGGPWQQNAVKDMENAAG
jgi:hypothetical protein